MPMTKERAAEVLALVRKEDAFDGKAVGCREVLVNGRRRWITNGVTVEEDQEIRDRWSRGPGYWTYNIAAQAVADEAQEGPAS